MRPRRTRREPGSWTAAAVNRIVSTTSPARNNALDTRLANPAIFASARTRDEECLATGNDARRPSEAQTSHVSKPNGMHKPLLSSRRKCHGLQPGRCDGDAIVCKTSGHERLRGCPIDSCVAPRCPSTLTARKAPPRSVYLGSQCLTGPSLHAGLRGTRRQSGAALVRNPSGWLTSEATARMELLSSLDVVPFSRDCCAAVANRRADPAVTALRMLRLNFSIR